MNERMQIAERLHKMPSKCRAMYRRATEGESLRACVNSQCLECCGRQSGEVVRCTDLGCPLYAVRPCQNGSGSAQDGQFTSEEGPNGAEGE